MSLIAEFFASLALQIGERCLDAATAHGLPIPARVHKRQLANALRRMPFIYKDLELDIVTDFVDVDISGVNPDTLRSRGVRSQDSRHLFEQLRGYHRLALVGDAGIGKTTLCRFAIQTIIGATTRAPPIHKRERIVPFFVPLKAVDNFAPLPIYRYLLANYKYLHGVAGSHRLNHLAASRRAMLFLDGYDEISYVGGSNFIKEELAVLFGPRTELARHKSVDPQTHPLYSDLRDCRLWLTSRPEFLRSNPIQFGQGTALLAASGVHTHRERLAHQIFESHRRRHSFRSETLQAEEFMYRLRTVGDEALEKISDNPLFLTILCYVYASEAQQGRPPEASLRNGVYGLVSECVNLLIEDLDQHKALELDGPARRAMIVRRSAWPKEKVAFLQYLAATSYLESHSILGEQWVLTAARKFFESTHEWPNKTEILQGLGTKDAARDLVRQLVLSDIFTSVDRPGRDPIYDFPHRRFREVLAADHWNTAAGLSVICENLTVPGFVELIPVYVARSRYWSQVVDRAIVDIAAGHCPQQVGQILDRCLATNSASTGDRDAKVTALLRALQDCPEAQVPASLLQHFSGGSVAHWSLLSRIMDNAVQIEDRRLLAVVVPPMARAFPDRAIEAIRQFWSTERPFGDFTFDMLTYTTHISLRDISTALRSLWRRPSYEDVTSREFARFFTITYRQSTSSLVRDEVMKMIEAHFHEVDDEIHFYISFTVARDKNRDPVLKTLEDDAEPGRIREAQFEGGLRLRFEGKKQLIRVGETWRTPIATETGSVAPKVWLDDNS